MEFRILGPLEVGDGQAQVPLGGRKPRALLARLLLDVNRTVSVERLVEDLWGQSPPDTAAKMVQIYVSQLRKVLPEGTLRTRPPGYVLEVPPAAIDLHRFEQLRGEGRAALAGGDPERAAALLREAGSLWRGPALAEFADEPFAAPEQAALEELRLGCREDRIDAELALGRHGDLVGELEALVGRHELRERLRRQQMLALHRSGREAEALAAYRAFRAALAGELGMEPSARLRELEQAILLQDPALQVEAEPARGTPAPPRPAARRPAAPRRAVGREAELERLDGALEAVLRGERRAVFVGGEAGIGKTTLVEAFLAGRDDLLVGHGQCVERRGAGEPYMPLLDALGGLAGRDHGGDALACLERRAPTWLAQLPWLVEPGQAGALDRRVRGATRERMLRELVEALGALAAERPVALVLEDLHWADASTLQALGVLAGRREPARLLLIGTHRTPDDGEQPLPRLVNELCARRLAVRLELGGLGEPAVAELLAERAAGSAVPPGVAAALWRRSGGNPLFLDHLAGHWEATGDAEAGVPATLAAFIADRLAALGPGDCALLEAAGVLGTEFSIDAAAAALGAPAEEVAARAAGLALLEPRGDDGRYAFAHDLHRELIYERIPADRRAELHARAGAHLETAAGPALREAAAELAAHFVRARSPARAVRFLKLAAEQALARNAHEEGVVHLHAALDAAAGLEEGPERTRAEVELLSMLGQASVAIGGWSDPGAEAALSSARELAAQLADNEPLVSVLLALATLYEVRGDYEACRAATDEYLALAPDGPPGRRLESHELLACNLFHMGAFTRALEHADLGLMLFELGEEDGGYSTFPATMGDDAAVSCQDWAALALWFLGHPDQALERGRRAIALASEPGRAHSLATARAQLSTIYLCRGEAAAARELAEATIEAAEEQGYAYRAASGRVLRGWALAAQGEPERGVEQLLRGLQQSRAAGVHMDDPLYLGLLGDAYRLSGELEAALSAVDEGLAIGRRERAVFYEPELHRLRGALLLAGGGAVQEAEASLEQAVVLARRQGSRALELRAATTLGRVWLERGQGAEARALVAAVYEAFREGRDTPDLRAAEAVLSAQPAPAGAPRTP
jgi:DNA-binding SARP family transcriptional activator